MARLTMRGDCENDCLLRETSWGNNFSGVTIFSAAAAETQSTAVRNGAAARDLGNFMGGSRQGAGKVVPWQPVNFCRHASNRGGFPSADCRWSDSGKIIPP